MDYLSFNKIYDEPFEFRDTLKEGIQYSRSQSNYRFKLLRIIRYFLKKPKLLLFTKCVIGFCFVTLPLIGVIVSAHYHCLTLIPVIISETLSIVILLCLFIQKLYDDNKYKMNISPYWVRKAYYDMFHFFFVHSFILWIIVATYRFNNYLGGLNIVNDNDNSKGIELKGSIIIKLVLIMKYHTNDYSSKTWIYVGNYYSDNDNFFNEVQEKAQMICLPILLLASIMFGKVRANKYITLGDYYSNKMDYILHWHSFNVGFELHRIHCRSLLLIRC